MSHYTTILLDADGTLLDFDTAEKEALTRLYKEAKIPVTEETLAVYSRINGILWKKLEKNEVTRQELKDTRFSLTFKELGLDRDDGIELSKKYQQELGKQAQLLDGAFETVQKMAENFELAIITNGNQDTQHSRIQNSGLKSFMKHIFISEEMNVQKPNREFFEQVLNQIDEKDTSRILVVGDSLSSDILGANNAGLDSCWINANNESASKAITPTYTISSIKELLKILGLPL